jgi:hypothetical protein
MAGRYGPLRMASCKLTQEECFDHPYLALLDLRTGWNQGTATLGRGTLTLYCNSQATACLRLIPAVLHLSNLREVVFDLAGENLERDHLNCLQQCPLLERVSVSYHGNVDLGQNFPEGEHLSFCGVLLTFGGITCRRIFRLLKIREFFYCLLYLETKFRRVFRKFTYNCEGCHGHVQYDKDIVMRRPCTPNEPFMVPRAQDVQIVSHHTRSIGGCTSSVPEWIM